MDQILASATESKSVLESEVATLGTESRILKAHNASLAAEVESLKADLDAFWVENDQLNAQNELYAAALEDLYSCLGEGGSASTFSSNGGSTENNFSSHQQIVPMKMAMQASGKHL